MWAELNRSLGAQSYFSLSALAPHPGSENKAQSQWPHGTTRVHWTGQSPAN